MNQKRNRGNAIVIAIVAVVLVAAAVTAFFVIKARKYDPGKYEAGVYENRWADIRFTVPEGYTQNTSGNFGDEWDAYFFVKDSKAFGVCTHKGKEMSAKEGLDYIKGELEKGLSLSQFQSLANVISTKDYHYPKIAGKSYTSLPIVFNYMGFHLNLTFAARDVHNNGVIVLFFVGENENDIDQLMNLIKKH